MDSKHDDLSERYTVHMKCKAARGVEKLFTPGTPLQDIVDWLRKRFPEEKRLQQLSVSSS